jgi:SAP domain
MTKYSQLKVDELRKLCVENGIAVQGLKESAATLKDF